ncbi:Nuclear fragile X mental retardation-interacting protein 1, conserved domain containing protein [Parasponia andersonii]|uniref:Nuclear fragile X mental retardation-interacting protein 1, conserved domain containing protein n=1 Tax=Parasponia andersonii TaxID=3476 RepID=A0A2P5D0V6_PARAD|nr:Nuclear fragile X mental retardation-interacting protein 1, conserved domain containing protein [Parasponia andersonii]
MRRSLSLTYTEQEILKWREERRKNYPSKGNLEKKLAEKQQDKEVLEREAKIRREQLKDILAKQAELGVEVAEIPGCYLSDPKQGQGREENGRPLNKKGRLHKKFDKRGRHDKKDRYSKKQRLNDNRSSNVPLVSKREPSLLEKLLSADITRDKSHLLQAFRFMVMNSFFKDGPDKRLTFPSVIVKEGSNEDGVVDAGKGVSEVTDEAVVGKTCENVDIIDDDNDDRDNDDDDGGGGGGDNSEDDEEEGEIIN